MKLDTRISQLLMGGGNGTHSIDFNIQRFANVSNPYSNNLDNKLAIVATIANVKRTVTITAPTNGTVSISYNGQSYSSGSFQVNHGDSIIITATPNTGYSVSTITCGGQTISSGDSFVVTADVSVSATFSLRYFTVTINQPSNGRISVHNNYDSSTHTTTFNAAYGSVIRTTVSANTGYSFGSLTINGTSQSNNGNYTIVANTTISATININYYTVSCTQPANGSLRYSYGGSEHSSGSVPYNGSVKVIARANSGYSVSAVYKNGSSIGNNSSTNITGNTTFTAS